MAAKYTEARIPVLQQAFDAQIALVSGACLQYAVINSQERYFGGHFREIMI